MWLSLTDKLVYYVIDKVPLNDIVRRLMTDNPIKFTRFLQTTRMREFMTIATTKVKRKSGLKGYNKRDK